MGSRTAARRLSRGTLKQTADDIASTAVLLRDSFPGPILIAEGPTDALLLEGLFEGSIRTVVGAGKTNVIGAIAVLESMGEGGYLGIVDRDFDALVQTRTPANVVQWDYHDMEMMILHSSALGSVERHQCVPSKVESFARETSLITALLDRARPLGAIRWISFRDGLGFNFDHVRLDRFVDAQTLEVDIQGIAASCLQDRHGSQRGLPELVEAVTGAMDEGMEDAHLCRGHDVTEILARGLKRCLASHGGEAPGVASLEGSLRASFTLEDFYQTGTARAIQEWQRREPSFAFLVDHEP
jgi:hypothetical protein